MAEDDFSYLSDTEERLYIFSTFFLGSMGLLIAVIILFSLKKAMNDENITNSYNRKSMIFPIISVFGSVLIYIELIFFMNDLIIPWDLKNNEHYSTIIEATQNTSYFTAKIAFYYSFTFNVQSMLYQRQQMSLFLKIWMILVGAIVFFGGLVYIIDDTSEYSLKEIGFTETRNIYFSMYLSHEGAVLARMDMLMLGVVDLIYFAILIYIYISRLKSLKSLNEEGVKGVVLVVFACVIYWIELMAIGLNWRIKWVGNMMDIISDDLCLYFMIVTSSKQLYYSLFGVFHSCFGKLIYGSSNYKYQVVPTQTEEE